MILATVDLETDPFEHGKVPRPFVAGFYDGTEYATWWNANCVDQFVSWLRTTTKGPYLIYAHNGGKFDYFYFLRHFAGTLRIVNSRIIQASIGPHEFRDSFAIMPFPLRDYDKDQIDYQKMRASVREQHKPEIISYLRKDCTSLHELVVAFHAEFGDNLTIGGSALKQLRKRHAFKSGGRALDEKFRTKFYFGGRVQVFKSGIIKGPVSIYDVNSMYPHVMDTCLHPVGTAIIVDKRIRPNTCFVVAEGENHGAFPVRSKDGSLSFTEEKGIFHTTIHEWNAAEQTGTFRPKRVIKTYGFDDRITFSDFVSHFYNERRHARNSGDKIRTIFCKYVLNSSYGKFAQNPENYADYEIRGRTDAPLLIPWEPAYLTDEYVIWRKPTEHKHYYNICTGASITGAARAILLTGLSHAVHPLYCDTDSIICESLRGVSVDSDALGAWKLEATGNLTAIAGKKLYAVWQSVEGQRTCIKKAHKGARLTDGEIYRIAQGEVVTAVNDVPGFKLDGSHQFVTRRIRKTV